MDRTWGKVIDWTQKAEDRVIHQELTGFMGCRMVPLFTVIGSTWRKQFRGKSGVACTLSMCSVLMEPQACKDFRVRRMPGLDVYVWAPFSLRWPEYETEWGAQRVWHSLWDWFFRSCLPWCRLALVQACPATYIKLSLCNACFICSFLFHRSKVSALSWSIFCMSSSQLSP